jgi:hypothetical protein
MPARRPDRICEVRGNDIDSIKQDRSRFCKKCLEIHQKKQARKARKKYRKNNMEKDNEYQKNWQREYRAKKRAEALLNDKKNKSKLRDL